MLTNAPRSLALALLLSLMIAWSWCFWTLKAPNVGELWDDGYYMVSARALLDGKGFVLPSRPGPPGRPRYPIGFPAVLAAAFALTGSSEAGIAYGVVLLSAWVFAVCAFVWVRRLGVDDLSAAITATAAMFACLPRTRHILADLPLCAISALLLLRSTGAASKAGHFVDGALAGFAFLLRRPGIVLLPACLIGPRRAGSRSAVLAGFLAIDLPFEWYMLRFAHTRREAYIAEAIQAGWGRISTFAAIVWRNATNLVTTVPQSAAPFLYSATLRTVIPAGIVYAAFVALWTLVGWGVYSLVRDHGAKLASVCFFYVATLAIIIVWPWEVGLRLALPLTPVTVFALGAGAWSKWRGRPMGAAVWAFLLCGNMALVARAVLVTGPDQIRAANQAQVFDVIRTRAESRAVIATESPEMVYLHTGRQGIPILSFVEESLDPDSVGLLKEWLPAVEDRPLYLLGSCQDSPEAVATQTHSIQRHFVTREIFRTPDCMYWFGVLTAPASPQLK